MTAPTVNRDLEHLPQLAALTGGLLLLIVVMSTMHASDTLAYLMAVGILTALDTWSPR